MNGTSATSLARRDASLKTCLQVAWMEKVLDANNDGMVTLEEPPDAHQQTKVN